MAERIHITIERAEKERFRRLAAREGKSLSEWLREAARERLETSESELRLDSREALEAFFASCDQREHGREPDWEAQKGVIEASAAAGGSGT